MVFSLAYVTMLYVFIFIAVSLTKFIDTLPLEFIHNNYKTQSNILNVQHRDLGSKYEVVYLPVVFPVREAVGEVGLVSENEFNFEAFGRTISLRLKPNQNLISPGFKTYVQYGNNQTKLLPDIEENCHYLHRDKDSVASISICEPDAVQGLLLLDNLTFEIHPLTSELQTILKLQKLLLSSSQKEKRIAHIIRQIPQFTLNNSGENFLTKKDFLIKKSLNNNENDENMVGNSKNKAVDGLTAEVALFFDTAAYAIFSPYFDYDEAKLRNMLLAYMNGIQALYHHTSLGINLEFVLVRLDIMKSQPYDMPHYDGERSQLLNSFCDYQKNLNVDDDDNPDHWDMALYVSGLDFFAYENGRKSDVTMGLATVGGVCFPEYNCVIAEMGTTNMFGKPFPSAGFTSVYILAHEIGHNLGMHHDSIGNSCPKEGYIMSPSRGVHGETQWSTCSADVMKKLHKAKCLHDSSNFPPPSLDHSSFRDIPGQSFTAKQQCEIFLQDKDAVVSPDQMLSKVCYSIKCKTPNRSGYYYSGPALDGTECGRDMVCVGGECIFKIIPTVAPLTFGGWGPWKRKSCTSGCIENSHGYQIRYRLCNNPAPVNTDRGCKGSGYDVVVCKDDVVCKKLNKKSAIKYASEKCEEFSKLLYELDVNGTGLQAPHENDRIWMACAIFCQKKDSGTFYTPRIELNDLGVSPYFPDGTWCHRDNNGENYYCRRHHCLPESFTFNSGNKFTIHEIGDEIPFSQNANPRGEIDELLKQYLSLFPNGKPMQTILKPSQIKPPNEEDWETKDYIELPYIKNNEANNYEASDRFVFDFK